LNDGQILNIPFDKL
jgi:mRNA (2'-O-methyladenosine-N6-)-methyltransferase